jgi:hypothetical protein
MFNLKAILAGKSDPMTTDIVAREDPGTAERASNLNDSNIGLFPQLVDVIRALTDGQELLSQKLRAVRISHASQWGRLDASSYEEATDVADPLPLVDRESSPVGVALTATLDETAATPTRTRSTDLPRSEPSEDLGREPNSRPLPSSTATTAIAAPVNRDYNYFDELDARLADLHDSPD